MAVNDTATSDWTKCDTYFNFGAKRFTITIYKCENVSIYYCDTCDKAKFIWSTLFSDAAIIGLDIEATTTTDVITFGNETDIILFHIAKCCPLDTVTILGAENTTKKSRVVPKWLRKLLGSQHIVKIMCGTSEDVRFVEEQLAPEVKLRQFFDLQTFVRAVIYVIDPACTMGISLADMYEYLFHEKLDKTAKTSLWSQDLTDKQIIYAGKDCLATIQVHRALIEGKYRNKEPCSTSSVTSSDNDSIPILDTISRKSPYSLNKKLTFPLPDADQISEQSIICSLQTIVTQGNASINIRKMANQLASGALPELRKCNASFEARSDVAYAALTRVLESKNPKLRIVAECWHFGEISALPNNTL